MERSEQIWNEMVEFFGENFANPDHEPKRFLWQMKLYRYLYKYKHETHTPQNTETYGRD